jgi:hypothetical protein
MQRHIKSLLIKCHKGHHVSLRRWRGRGVLRHVTGHKFRHYHKSLVHEALQMAMCDLGRVQSYSAMLKREGAATLSIPQKSPLSLSPPPLSLSPFLGSRKEARRQHLIVQEDVRLSKGGRLLL